MAGGRPAAAFLLVEPPAAPAGRESRIWRDFYFATAPAGRESRIWRDFYFARAGPSVAVSGGGEPGSPLSCPGLCPPVSVCRQGRGHSGAHRGNIANKMAN